MRKWMATAVLWLSVLGILSFGSAARANVLTIEFDFKDSVFTALGFSIPPNGQILLANLSLSMPALGSATPLSGPASVGVFQVFGTLDVPIGFLTMITGSFAAVQVGTGYGTFNAAGGTVLITRDFTIMGGIAANCIGLVCLPIFPLLVIGTQAVNDTVPFPINNVSVPGSATIMTDLTFTVNGIDIVINVVGEEVDRTVPEPRAPFALAAGLAGLAGAWWLRGRRGARH